METVSGQRAVSQGWRLGLGAEVLAEGVRFRVWAPLRRRVEAVVEENGNEKAFALAYEDKGYFSGLAPGLKAGALYRYRLDREGKYPDPCSRFQPQGPHGPSMVVDPSAFPWSDAAWEGVTVRGQVFYEMHVGAFTPEGSFEAAAAQLEELRELGITLVELMPVAECPGRWDWGYDGVDLFAPYHRYGGPEDLKRFVDRAHALGLGVVLDVVYNHLGPDGCYLQFFSGDYFSETRRTEWGQAMNFDGPNAHGVREFFAQNACYWVAEYHMDGLRFDATQNMYDRSPAHIIPEIAGRARRAAGARKIVLVGENEPQDVRLVLPAGKGGAGLDALWVDDFHHSLRVALTGQREAYLTDYRGTAQELVSAAKRCLLYQGQYYAWQDGFRGTAVGDEPAPRFVFFIQNHDQVANHLRGLRITEHAGPCLYRAAATFLLLLPQTPLLFMGQEFGASTPFTYFSDVDDPLCRTYNGRKSFVAQFESYAHPEVIARLPDPGSEATFSACKLRFSERERYAPLYGFHKELLRLRREDSVIARQDRREIDGAVLSDTAFVLRYSGGREGDRLLAVNLGPRFTYAPLAEPLLVPPRGEYWRPVFSSDAPRFGGSGSSAYLGRKDFTLPAETALLFSSHGGEERGQEIGETADVRAGGKEVS